MVDPEDWRLLDYTCCRWATHVEDKLLRDAFKDTFCQIPAFAEIVMLGFLDDKSVALDAEKSAWSLPHLTEYERKRGLLAELAIKYVLELNRLDFDYKGAVAKDSGLRELGEPWTFAEFTFKGENGPDFILEAKSCPFYGDWVKISKVEAERLRYLVPVKIYCAFAYDPDETGNLSVLDGKAPFAALWGFKTQGELEQIEPGERIDCLLDAEPDARLVDLRVSVPQNPTRDLWEKLRKECLIWEH